jgi:hypothetical protein
MCKHVAAALCGAGARLNAEPELLFRLRAVDAGEIFANLDAALPASRSGAGAQLDAKDLSDILALSSLRQSRRPKPNQGRRVNVNKAFAFGQDFALESRQRQADEAGRTDPGGKSPGRPRRREEAGLRALKKERRGDRPVWRAGVRWRNAAAKKR